MQVPQGYDPQSWTAGHNEGYCQALDDERLIDARNRDRLDDLRHAVTARARMWQQVIERPHGGRMHDIVVAGNYLRRAALALAEHCAPRSET